MPDLITQIDQIATKPYFLKARDPLWWHNQIISIAYTVDGHAIITTIVILPFGNLKHTVTTIINSA